MHSILLRKLSDIGIPSLLVLVSKNHDNHAVCNLLADVCNMLVDVCIVLADVCDVLELMYVMC